MNDGALYGLVVAIPRNPCRRCGHLSAVIREPAGEYYADLKCARCNARRGSLSERTAKIIQTVAAKFGVPAAITLRR